MGWQDKSRKRGGGNNSDFVRRKLGEFNLVEKEAIKMYGKHHHLLSSDDRSEGNTVYRFGEQIINNIIIIANNIFLALLSSYYSQVVVYVQSYEYVLNGFENDMIYNKEILWISIKLVLKRSALQHYFSINLPATPKPKPEKIKIVNLIKF